MFFAIKRLVKHTGIYALGVGLNAALAFLLIPVYTRFLSQSNFGRLEILQTFLKVLLFLIPLGFTSAILKCYHRDARNPREKLIFASTAFFTVLILALVEIIILSLFASSLSQFLIGLDWPLVIYLLLVASFLTVSQELGLSFLRAQEKSKQYTAVFVLRFILTLGITIYLVVGLNFGLAGVILGNLVAQFITLLFFLPRVLNYVKISYSQGALTKLLSFGLPILPASCALWVMDLSDRYFLRFFLSLDKVAIYSLGYRVGFILEVLLVIPFQLAWPAFSFRIAKYRGHRKIYSRTLTYFFLIGVFGVMILTLFAPEIIKILAPSEYREAFYVVPFVAFSYLFYGLHFVLSPGIHLKEKTRYYPLLIIIPALFNILLNFYFVPHFGFRGAAWTTFISFGFLLILTYVISQYFYPVKQEWRRLAKILAMGLIILGLLRVLQISFLPMLILAKLGLLLFFWLGLWALGFFEEEEMRRLKDLLVKIRK